MILQDKIADELNSFFSNVLKNLKIPKLRKIDPLAERMTYPTLKSILKYRKYLNVIAIGDLNIRSDSQFSLVSIDEVLKKIQKSIHIQLHIVPMFLQEF